MPPQLHKVQMSILQTLRHSPSARFSTLMQPTGLQSDGFKFHVRKLTSLGFVAKLPNGSYALTPSGKEFANKLDRTSSTIQQHPKLSVLVIAERAGPQGAPEYLFQQRQRHPFYGFWSCIGGPVHWGETAEATAARELHKQTGLQGDCTVRAFYRKRDYLRETGELLEDKLFYVMSAANLRGEPAGSWPNGHNAWLTLDAFRQQPHYFMSVCNAIQLIRAGQTYATEEAYYNAKEY